jgi:hypothetical protein
MVHVNECECNFLRTGMIATPREASGSASGGSMRVYNYPVGVCATTLIAHQTMMTGSGNMRTRLQI